MAVTVQTQFPRSFIAGDTIRVNFSDSRFPSTLWTAKVLFQSATANKSFTAAVGTGTSFDLVISAVESAKILPDTYTVSLIYTETATDERQTDEDRFLITVYSNPAIALTKSIARQTLEAMESAFLKVSKNPRLSVNFVGQSFTNRNLDEFQDAIDRQRALVKGEEVQLGGPGGGGKVFHPL